MFGLLMYFKQIPRGVSTFMSLREYRPLTVFELKGSTTCSSTIGLFVYTQPPSRV